MQATSAIGSTQMAAPCHKQCPIFLRFNKCAVLYPSAATRCQISRLHACIGVARWRTLTVSSAPAPTRSRYLLSEEGMAYILL